MPSCQLRLHCCDMIAQNAHPDYCHRVRPQEKLIDLDWDPESNCTPYAESFLDTEKMRHCNLLIAFMMGFICDKCSNT